MLIVNILKPMKGLSRSVVNSQWRIEKNSVRNDIGTVHPAFIQGWTRRVFSCFANSMALDSILLMDWYRKEKAS